MFSRQPAFAHKMNTSFEQRCHESARVRERYSDRLPVIVERAPNSDVPAVDKSKYLIPREMTMGQLVWVLRKRISLAPEQAIFVFVNSSCDALPSASAPGARRTHHVLLHRLPASNALLSNVYLKHKDEDGFLYIRYSGENTFGAHL